MLHNPALIVMPALHIPAAILTTSSTEITCTLVPTRVVRETTYYRTLTTFGRRRPRPLEMPAKHLDACKLPTRRAAAASESVRERRAIRYNKSNSILLIINNIIFRWAVTVSFYLFFFNFVLIFDVVVLGTSSLIIYLVITFYFI